MDSHLQIAVKLDQLEEALRLGGRWSDDTPSWVYTYSSGPVPDIWQWLQYVYLPLRRTGKSCTPHYLAPVIASHLDDRPEQQLILRLAIELDSLSPRITKKKNV